MYSMTRNFSGHRASAQPYPYFHRSAVAKVTNENLLRLNYPTMYQNERRWKHTNIQTSNSLSGLRLTPSPGVVKPARGPPSSPNPFVLTVAEYAPDARFHCEIGRCRPVCRRPRMSLGVPGCPRWLSLRARSSHFRKISLVLFFSPLFSSDLC